MAAKKVSKKTSAKCTKSTGKAKASQTRAEAAKPDGKLSQLHAAAEVLAEAGAPLTAKAMVETMGRKGY